MSKMAEEGLAPQGATSQETSPEDSQKNTTPHAMADGLLTYNNMSGQHVHLGSSSVAAFAMQLRDNKQGKSAQDLLGSSILPVFGLEDSSATYPFINLWSPINDIRSGARQMREMLPNDSECLSLFALYKDVGFVFYPIIADISQLEEGLHQMLAERTRQSQWERGSLETDDTVYGKTLASTGILFAVLAAGCQASDITRKDRELNSKIYSFTVRLAQTLGLHKDSPISTPSELTIRRRLWWSIVFQDLLLSISFDRESGTAIIGRGVSLPPTQTPNALTYSDCMHRLTKVTMNVLYSRMQLQGPQLEISDSLHELEGIETSAAPYLRDINKCETQRQQLEHYAISMHTSFLIFELCRPALQHPPPPPSRSSAAPSPSSLSHHGPTNATDINYLRKRCIQSLVDTVRAFLGLHKISPEASRGWSFVHRALSATLILGLLGEFERSSDNKSLLEQMIKVLGAFIIAQKSNTTVYDDGMGGSVPFERALEALKSLGLQEHGHNGIVDGFVEKGVVDGGAGSMESLAKGFVRFERFLG
ncbi:MAG: hypothetical protein M1834_003568 [Cirrosporium novae-zelandiae]|nr:MAG: hypothetical protein M1834_003568 [Cirrosporium novae-zelandiae]